MMLVSNGKPSACCAILYMPEPADDAFGLIVTVVAVNETIIVPGDNPGPEMANPVAYAGIGPPDVMFNVVLLFVAEPLICKGRPRGVLLLATIVAPQAFLPGL
jgi:hypothetical protein